MVIVKEEMVDVALHSIENVSGMLYTLNALPLSPLFLPILKCSPTVTVDLHL